MGEAFLEAQREQREAEVAFSIESRIKDALARGRQALWDLAEALHEFDEEAGWLKLGHENRSQWLADSDVTITTGTYFRLVRTWRKLVVEKGVDADRLRLLDQAKVAIVTDKIAANEVLIDDALDDVAAMPASDLREKYLGKREVITTVEVESNVGPEGPLDAGLFEPTEEPNPEDVPEPVAEEIGVVAAAAILQGEVVEAAYEFPGWVTHGTVDAMLQEFSGAVDSGASFPRVGRRHLQIAVELANAWRATYPR